jgi:hypothetical protein
VPRAFLFGQPARWRNGWLTLATMTAGTGESRVVLLHLDERGAVLWNRDLGPGSIASSDTSGFVSAEDRIFVAGPDALFAIDAQSGGLIWRQPIAALAHRHTCVDDGRRLFYTTVEGHVGAVTREGAPLWERSLSAQGIWSPASVLGDRIVVPGNGLLHLLDATSGALIQQIAVGQCPYSALTFCGNRALLGGGDPPYWGMLIGFDVQADSRQGLTCAFAQQRRVAQADRPLDLVLQVSGCEEPIRRVSVDFSPLEGPASCAPDYREGDRFIFTVQPGPGQRWGAYALPVEVETSRAIYVSTAFLDLDDPSTGPRRVLLPGYTDVVQEEMDWSGAALMAAVRRQYGDDVDQGAMRDMIDSIRDRSGYLPFDTWRIIARRALSTSARRTSELPEFRGDDPA